VQLATQDQIWLAVDDELGDLTASLEAWHFGGGRRGDSGQSTHGKKENSR
jgi:hypothetical protein